MEGTIRQLDRSDFAIVKKGESNNLDRKSDG